jgi:hypothetical protein
MAPFMLAPLESVIVPLMLPVVSWAIATTENTVNNATNTKAGT